jgi:hypothetical protein
MFAVASGAVVAGPGACLVDAAPSGPGEVEAGRSGDAGNECREQAADFVDGQRDQPAVYGSAAISGGDRGQDRRGEHDQGGVAVPGVPASDLVLVEADGAFRVLEAGFHCPADASDTHERGQADPGRCVAAVEREFTVADTAADEQPVETGGLIGWWEDRDPGPVVVAAAFRAVAGAVSVPGFAAQGGGDVVAAGDPVHAADVDPVALRDRENVAEPAGLQITA